MGERFHVCVIGCGAMGGGHAGAWQAREDAKVVSVFDPQQDRMAALAQTTGAAACDSWRDAVLQDGVNVVSVCTPVCHHSEVACFAAQNGRHVLTEKPIALTLEQAQQMIAAARDNDVLLSVSLQYRGFYRNRKYKELFEAGQFGGPVIFRYMDMRSIRPKIAMHMRSGNGGPVVDMMCHYVDTARFVTGEEPLRVRAAGHCFAEHKPPVCELHDPAIDAAVVHVEMTGGHVMDVFLNWGMALKFPSFGDEMLIGPEICARPCGAGVEVQYVDHREVWGENAETPPGPTVRVNGLAGAILGATELEVTGEDGLAALRVSLAALQSIETGRTVEL